MRKIISLMAVAITVLMASFSASADESGKCGPNVEWKVYQSAGSDSYYTLEISGHGAMYNYDYNDNRTPLEWRQLSLNKIIINGGVTIIGNSAFSGYTTLRSVSLPKTLKSIGNGAFSGCSGLRSITFPRSLTKIGEEAFYGCSGLTSLTMPNSLTSIGEGAFSRCKSLTSITIPSSLASIGNSAFSSCDNLKVINSLRRVPPKCTGYAFSRYNYRNCRLNVPAGAEASYRNHPAWGWFYKAKQNTTIKRNRTTRYRR